MKRLLLFFLLFSTTLLQSATAQNTAYGDRIPAIRKGVSWIQNQAPTGAPYTFLLLCSVKNPASLDCIENLSHIQEQSDNKLCVVIIGRETDEELLPHIEGVLSPRFAAVSDPDRKIFDSFNVNFVPYGILVDAKHMTIWMGNPTQEQQSVIDLIK